MVAGLILSLFVGYDLLAAGGGDGASQVRESRIDALFSPYARSDSPGCALGVYEKGRIALARGYGMASLELGVAIAPSTVFDIGSLSKQFTAFSVLLLAHDGRLTLDDDIRKYLPEIPAYETPVTIRHLLHHTGGLRDYIELMSLGGIRTEDLTTKQDALDILARQKVPLFAAGSDYVYSNTGYFLLGIIVERVSGTSLREFARDRIFGPLAMTHTQYNDEHARVVSNRAVGYSPKDGGGFSVNVSNFEQNGDGGVLTTVEDLFRWDQNFDAPVVGDRSLLDELQQAGRLTNGREIDYALGLRIGKYRGLRTVGHTGSWAGYRALFYRFPDQRFSVACLCNRSAIDRTELMQKIAELYFEDLMDKAAPLQKALSRVEPVPPAEVGRLVGAYLERASGVVLYVTERGGQLAIDAQGEQLTLIRVAKGSFRETEGNRDFRFRPEDGKRTRLDVHSQDGPTRSFEAFDPWSPDRSRMADFAGDFVSDEVPGILRFQIVDGQLALKHRVFPAQPWRPTLPGTFAWEDLTAKFQRDSSGRVSGFRMDAGRMSGFVFRKIPEDPR